MQNIKEHLFSIAFLTMLLLAGSQVTAQISASNMSMSQGSHEVMILELPGADDKMVAKLWTDFAKDEFKGKTKRDRKSKEMQTLNVDIPGVSAGSKVDMYAKVNERGNGSELMVWIGSNDGWVNPRTLPDRYVEAEKMLMRFALDVTKAQIALEVEEEEDRLKDLEKELDNLRKDKEKYERNIEKAKEEIAKMEAAIVENEKNQEDKEKEIEEQEEVVKATKKKGDF